MNQNVKNCIDFIQNYFRDNGTENTKAVIGISGGKDSTIAAALLVRALGAERVVGVMMPNKTQNDIEDSIKVCDILGIKHYTINIGYAYDALISSFTYDAELPVSDQITTNAPARLRMNALYMVAAAVGGRVCNTGNASEAFIGYTTKYGDLAGDFAVLRPFTVTEIYEMGDSMEELPYDLVHKAPADGMSGKTDEDNIGIPYRVIDDHLLYGKIPADPNIWERMKTMHRRNIHKQDAVRLPMPYRQTFLFNKTWD